MPRILPQLRSPDVERGGWNGVVLAIVVVVVAVEVVAVPVVIDAVHNDQPFLRDPFPRMERTHTPQRNGRPRPVVSKIGDVVAVKTVRRPMMMVRRRTGVFRPCGRRVADMTGGSLMSRRARLGGGACGLGRSRSLRSPRSLRSARGLRSSRGLWSSRSLRSTCSLRSARRLWRSRLSRRAWRTSASARGTTVASSFRRSKCCSANGRAGDCDDCEFHEVVIVVVHSAPSLSAFGIGGRAHLALTLCKVNRSSVSDKPFWVILQDRNSSIPYKSHAESAEGK